MCKEMYGENEQLYVTLGYGDAREKEGRIILRHLSIHDLKK